MENKDYEHMIYSEMTEKEKIYAYIKMKLPNLYQEMLEGNIDEDEENIIFWKLSFSGKGFGSFDESETCIGCGNKISHGYYLSFLTNENVLSLRQPGPKICYDCEQSLRMYYIDEITSYAEDEYNEIRRTWNKISKMLQ